MLKQLEHCEYQASLKDRSYLVFDNFLSTQQCEGILELITQFRKRYQLNEIHRPFKERSLRYWVINGQQIEASLPDVWQLYKELNLFVNKFSGQNLYPLKDKLPTVNINIIKPGGEYRWHYDRNAVTALLYLNSVTTGELELYPNYRLGYRRLKFSALQQQLDALVKLKFVRDWCGQKISIKPQQGTMVVMRGDRCLHSVKTLNGTQERINLVMAYDELEATCSVEQALDTYLYTHQEVGTDDANYGQLP